MSALTANRNTMERNPSLRRYPILSGEIVYCGGLLAVLGSTGEAEMASDKAGLVVVGRAEEYVDNTSDGLYASAKTGCFLFKNSSTNAVTSAHIGTACYVEDDNTVSSNKGTNGIVAGEVFEIGSEGVWVIITPEAIAAAKAQAAVAAAQASATIDAPDITDSTTGTASVSHALVGPAAADYTATELKNNFATVAAEHGNLKDDVEAVNTVLSGVISKLKTAGLMAS